MRINWMLSFLMKIKKKKKENSVKNNRNNNQYKVKAFL